MTNESVASSRSAASVGSIKARLARTWALGYLALFFFAVLAITGLALSFHYLPSAPEAYFDVVDLRERGVLSAVREGHWLAARGAVIVVLLHLLRVALQRAYRPPRRGNWVVGVFLLGLTLLLAWTGTLLTWDQEGYWAIAGSLDPEAETPPSEDALLPIYVLHVLVLPLVVAGLIAFHLRRARRDDLGEVDRGGPGV